MANIKQLRQTADQVQTLLDKIGPNEEKITTLQNQLAGTAQSGLKTSIENNTNSINTNISNIEELKSKVATNKTSIENNTNNITTLQNQLQGSAQSGLSRNLKQLQDKINNNNTTIASNTARIDGLNTRVGTAEHDIRTLNQNAADITTNKLNINSLNTRVTNDEKSINSNTSNIVDLKTKVEKNAKDIKNINESSIEIQGILNKVPVNEQNIASKQDRLISGFNYKTINGNSLLGKGNISISNIKRLHDDSFKFNSGDKIVCIGDSTTAGIGASSETTKYVSVLSQLAGVPTINLGISGSTLCIGGSRGSNFNALSNAALKSTLSNKTVVTIMIGLNDFDQANDGINTHPAVGNKKQYTLGSPDSKDPLTIYGALYKWNEKIKELKRSSEYANTHFIWITPFPTGTAGQGRTDWNPLTQVNYAGYTLRDLCQAIINMATRYELPCIDVNLYCGICYNPNEPNSVQKYVPDKLHANDAGYSLIANCIYNWMCGGATRLDKVYFGSGKENTVKLLEALSLSFATSYMFGTSATTIPSAVITAITFNETAGSIAAKRKFTLIPTITPSYASGEGLVYESTDDFIASVNDQGIVVAHHVGTCTIMCRDTINGAYASYTLTVTPEVIIPLAKFNLITPEKLIVNSTADIKLNLTPSNTSQTNFTWNIQPSNLATWKETADGITITTTKQTGKITITCTSVDNPSLPPISKELQISRGSPTDLATLTFEDYNGTSEYNTSTHRLTSNYVILSSSPRAAICQQPFTLGKELRLKLHYAPGQYNIILGFCSNKDINKIDSEKEIWSVVGFNILVGAWNIYSDGQGIKSGIPRTANGADFKPAIGGYQSGTPYDVWLKFIFDEDTNTILSYYSTTGNDDSYIQIALPTSTHTTTAINLQKQLSELYLYEGHSNGSGGQNCYVDILYFGPRQD